MQGSEAESRHKPRTRVIRPLSLRQPRDPHMLDPAVEASGGGPYLLPFPALSTDGFTRRVLKENCKRFFRRPLSPRQAWIAASIRCAPLQILDPFKLHWTWTFWVEGLASSAYWDASREFSRSAFANGKLGLSDLVFFADLDTATLRRQKANDPTRTRNRHEMHLRIAPALKRWYRATAELDPSRIQFRLPPGGLEPLHLGLGRRPERSGTAIFDRFMRELGKS